MLDEYMIKLYEDLEIEGSPIQQVAGVFTLPIDPDCVITLTDLESAISFECVIAVCPQAKKEDLYEELLAANLFGEGTEGAILGLTADGKHLTLVRTIEERHEYLDFYEILEDFINSIDFWNEESIKYR